MAKKKKEDVLEQIKYSLCSKKPQFKGRGIHPWYGADPRGPRGAEIKMREAGNTCDNSFDKLSLYFQVKLYEKEITCPEIIEFY